MLEITHYLTAIGQDPFQDWLEDFALFSAIKEAHDGVQWTRWDTPLRDRAPAALGRAAAALADDVALHRFEQLLFERQWRALRTLCQWLCFRAAVGSKGCDETRTCELHPAW